MCILLLSLVLAANCRPLAPNSIMGGTEVATDEYPFLINRNLKCGGALITNQWILTAGHCEYDVGDLVTIGKFNLFAAPSSRDEVISVSESIAHPKFQRSATAEENDLRLVKLSSPSQALAARLPTPQEAQILEQPGTLLTVAGWGALEESGDVLGRLREVAVPLIANSVCADADHYANIRRIYDSMLCAGFAAGGKDACSGDSGSPLFKEVNGRGVIVGITSWGVGCGRPNRPGVYTRVSKYADWISSVLNGTYVPPPPPTLSPSPAFAFPFSFRLPDGSSLTSPLAPSFSSSSPTPSTVNIPDTPVFYYPTAPTPDASADTQAVYYVSAPSLAPVHSIAQSSVKFTSSAQSFVAPQSSGSKIPASSLYSPNPPSFVPISSNLKVLSSDNNMIQVGSAFQQSSSQGSIVNLVSQGVTSPSKSLQGAQTQTLRQVDPRFATASNTRVMGLSLQPANAIQNSASNLVFQDATNNSPKLLFSNMQGQSTASAPMQAQGSSYSSNVVMLGSLGSSAGHTRGTETPMRLMLGNFVPPSRDATLNTPGTSMGSSLANSFTLPSVSQLQSQTSHNFVSVSNSFQDPSSLSQRSLFSSQTLLRGQSGGGPASASQNAFQGNSAPNSLSNLLGQSQAQGGLHARNTVPDIRLTASGGGSMNSRGKKG